MTRLLNSYQIWPDCRYCPTGVGFEDHVPGPKHYDMLGRLLPEGVPVVDFAHDMWQEWLVPGGAVRFNHMHGRIDICQGPPPAGVGGAAALAGPPALTFPSAVGSSVLAPSVAGLARAPAAGACSLESLQEEGVWIQVHPPVSWPTKQNGTWEAYEHLKSRTTFKTLMRGPADLACAILEAHGGIYPECSICDGNRGYGEHLPAEKHYRTLWDKYLKVRNQPVQSMRDNMWNQWRIQSAAGVRGVLRVNELDGEILMCRGEPPPASLLSPSVGPMPLLPPSVAQRPPAPVGLPTGPFVPPPSTAQPTAQPTAAAAPAASAAPRPDGGGAPAASPLEVWLWRYTFAEAAQEAEDMLKAAKVPGDQLVCKVCGGSATQGGLAAHLLSPGHMRRVSEEACARPGSPLPPSAPHLTQDWLLPDGSRLVLAHLPLRCEELPAPSAAPGGLTPTE